jgi:hypothetical protein
LGISYFYTPRLEASAGEVYTLVAVGVVHTLSLPKNGSCAPDTGIHVVPGGVDIGHSEVVVAVVVVEASTRHPTVFVQDVVKQFVANDVSPKFVTEHPTAQSCAVVVVHSILVGSPPPLFPPLLKKSNNLDITRTEYIDSSLAQVSSRFLTKEKILLTKPSCCHDSYRR